MEKITREHWESMKRWAYTVSIAGYIIAFVSMAVLLLVTTGGNPAINALFIIGVFFGGIGVGYVFIPSRLQEAHKRSTGNKW